MGSRGGGRSEGGDFAALQNHLVIIVVGNGGEG